LKKEKEIFILNSLKETLQKLSLFSIPFLWLENTKQNLLLLPTVAGQFFFSIPNLKMEKLKNYERSNFFPYKNFKF